MKPILVCFSQLMNQDFQGQGSTRPTRWCLGGVDGHTQCQVEVQGGEENAVALTWILTPKKSFSREASRAFSASSGFLKQTTAKRSLPEPSKRTAITFPCFL